MSNSFLYHKFQNKQKLKHRNMRSSNFKILHLNRRLVVFVIQILNSSLTVCNITFHQMLKRKIFPIFRQYELSCEHITDWIYHYIESLWLCNHFIFAIYYVCVYEFHPQVANKHNIPLYPVILRGSSRRHTHAFCFYLWFNVVSSYKKVPEKLK